MDITEQNKLLTPKTLGVLLDSLPHLVMILDANGNILHCNRGGIEMLGYPMEELKGKPVWSWYATREANEFSTKTDLLSEKGEISFEGKVVKGGESDIWLKINQKLMESDNGSPLILETAIDISQQKKTERALAESRARTEAILESTAEAIITVDEEGYVTSVNTTAEEMFGYHADEIIGEFLDLLILSSYGELDNHTFLTQYISNGESTVLGRSREVRGRKKDGEIFPIELALNEIDFGGERIFTGMIRDISKRRKLENEILRIAEDERRTIGQELHDGLGQLLSGIGLISRNLARRFESQNLSGSEEILEIAEMIKEADHYARDLAHGLAHVDLENDGLVAAVKRLCNRYQKFTEIKCKGEFPDEFHDDLGNMSLHLYRIIQEALSNAVYHGKATAIWVSMQKRGSLMRLRIEDNGIGFEVTNMDNLKGMGVKTMKYRAHLLGGNLDISKMEAGGTRVECVVPVNCEENKSNGKEYYD